MELIGARRVEVVRRSLNISWSLRGEVVGQWLIASITTLRPAPDLPLTRP
jgi:hypothetical protein